MGTVQTTDAAAGSMPSQSRPVWTFMPLHGKHGEGKFAFIDAEDYEWAQHFNWVADKHGYPLRTRKDTDGKWRTFLLHRDILGLVHGDGKQGEHINRNTFDNRRCNLRVVDSQFENMQNVNGHRNAFSKHRGVSWHIRRKKWIARVKLNYQQNFLGYFDDELAAAEAASEFRAKHMPYSEDARKETT